MKSNFQMLKEFEYFIPKNEGFLEKDEVELIRKHFQIAERSDIELQNLRDFVVMYFMKMIPDPETGVGRMFMLDVMSGLTGVIDVEKSKRGLPV